MTMYPTITATITMAMIMPVLSDSFPEFIIIFINNGFGPERFGAGGGGCRGGGV